ncbi:MAG: kinase [Acidobacteriota bacterium]
MIVSRTPFRVSFFGGGSDYPAWYLKHGGVVLGTTIDKYCYISCRHLPPFFHYKHRIVHSRIDNVTDINDITHPAVRGILEYMGETAGLEIHHNGDLPARSGLGSSSSFTVGLIHVLMALHGKMISKKDLASRAVHVEQDVLKEHVGSQDQILTTHGGFNMIEFRQDGSYDISPVILDREKSVQFQKHLMLFFTGFTRFASDIAKSHIDNLELKTRETRTMMQMAQEAKECLQSENPRFVDFGQLLREYWKYKRDLSDKVSTSEIDQIHDTGIRAGALGGKLLGAGGGGFFLFFVKPEDQPKVREALKDLVHVNFNLESTGSKIVIYEPTDFQ